MTILAQRFSFPFQTQYLDTSIVFHPIYTGQHRIPTPNETDDEQRLVGLNTRQTLLIACAEYSLL